MARLSTTEVIRKRREGVVLVFLISSFSPTSLDLFIQIEQELKLIEYFNYDETAFLVLYIHTMEGYQDISSLVPVTQKLGELELDFILVDELYEPIGTPHEYT
jgi:hypothetical protein